MSFLLMFLKNKWVWIGIAILIVILCFYFLIRSNRNLRIKNDRLEKNNVALMNDVVTYKDKLGKNAIEYQELDLTFNEFKKSTNSIITKLKNDLYANGIKLKNVERISLLQVNTIDSLKGIGKDTVYIDHNGNEVNYMCSINTPFLSGNVFVYSDRSCELTYKSIDSLTEVGYRKRTSLYLFKHEFPKIRLGPWEYVVKKSFANPASTIIFSETVNIYKNERKYRKAIK